MKKVSSLLSRMGLLVAGALALGACNRSQYAMLPKAPAYLNSAPVVAKVSRPAATSVATPVPAAPEALVTAPKPAVVAPATAPVAAAPAPQPTAPARVAAPVAAPISSASAATAEVPAPAKLNLVQRLALKKITKKLDKLASQSPQLRQHDAAAGTSRLDNKLRQVIIIGAVGVGLEILGVALSSGLIYVVGVIFILVALVLLLLYFLDKA